MVCLLVVEHYGRPETFHKLSIIWALSFPRGGRMQPILQCCLYCQTMGGPARDGAVAVLLVDCEQEQCLDLVMSESPERNGPYFPRLTQFQAGSSYTLLVNHRQRPKVILFCLGVAQRFQ